MARKKGRRIEEKWLYFLLGVSLTIFVVFLFTAFSGSSGETVTKKIVVEYDGVADTSGGFIQLKRNSASPSVLDWATFDNKERVVYFTVEDVYTATVTIDVPDNTPRGTYYLDYYVELIDGQKTEKTLSFYVG